MHGAPSSPEAEKVLFGIITGSRKMALSNIAFEDIAERNLLDQIQAGVPEGVLVDYKRDMYGRSDADVREFLKDVSSFAKIYPHYFEHGERCLTQALKKLSAHVLSTIVHEVLTDRSAVSLDAKLSSEGAEEEPGVASSAATHPRGDRPPRRRAPTTS
jgi:hypothetical protein